MWRGAISLLPCFKENRVVVAELIDKPGYAEILLISDEEEDFAPLSMFGGFEAELFSLERVPRTLKNLFPEYPHSTVKISHKDMTQEEAYSIIMGKKITLPSRQILAKRNLQWLYHDSDDARRATASKHYREEFGDELWDGSEAVFEN